MRLYAKMLAWACVGWATAWGVAAILNPILDHVSRS